MKDLFIEKMRDIYDEENNLESLENIDEAIEIEKHFSDVSFDEIAEKLGLTEETVDAHKLKKLI